MDKKRIPLSISFELLAAAIQSLNLDELLVIREYISSALIEQVAEEADEDQLVSESGVDYSLLQALLAGGAWEEADEETAQLMLEVSDQDELMLIDAAENFPISDLRIIDRLWVKYSNGRFGLSVQKQIWQKAGQNVEKFGEIVGWLFQGNWIQEKDIKFTYEAPVGHLPFVRSGLCYEDEDESWSAGYFTDSEGEDQFVQTVDVESIESIEIWKVFANRLTSESSA